MLHTYITLVICFCVSGIVQSSPLELVTFWGQNAAMATLGAKEPSLDYLCRHSPYTTIVLGYVYKFFDPDDFEEGLPSMNFTTHCKYYVHNRLSCPHMREAIHLCHVNNKKVLIGLGGTYVASEFSHFETKEAAISFAHKIWNLFLGGKEMMHLRPFGNVMLDGINMRMDEQDPENLQFFISTINNLRQQRNPAPGKTFLITISPTCHFPGTYFGPEEGKILSDPQMIPMIDQVYVWYTDSSCCIKGTPGFIHSHDEWNNLSTERNLNLYFGIPTKSQAADARCYLSPAEQMKIYKSYQNINLNLRGFVLVDNSHDIDSSLTVRYGFTKALIRTFNSYRIPSIKPNVPQPPYPVSVTRRPTLPPLPPTNPSPIKPTRLIPTQTLPIPTTVPPTIPVDESQPPIEETHPVADEAQPPVEETQPVLDESQPPVNTTKPSVEETQPPVEDIQPELTTTLGPELTLKENGDIVPVEPRTTSKPLSIQQTTPSKENALNIAQEAEIVDEDDNENTTLSPNEEESEEEEVAPTIIPTPPATPPGNGPAMGVNTLYDRSCSLQNNTINKIARIKCLKNLLLKKSKKTKRKQQLIRKLHLKQYFSNSPREVPTDFPSKQTKREPIFIPFHSNKKNTDKNDDKYYVVL